MGHYSEALGAAPPEAYMPLMVGQECALEEDHGSFLGPGWEEETPEAEPFQEPPGSLANRTGGSSYQVPLIPQEQAYAKHGSQEVQVTAAEGCPSAVASHPSGGGHWGLQERGREPGPSPRHAEEGVPRR